MVDVLALVYSTLANDPAVSALVVARVYPLRLPDAPEFPAVTFEETTSLDTRDLEGPSGLVNSGVQVDCWSASTSVEAWALGQAVIDAMNNAPLLGVASVDRRTLFENKGLRYRVSIDFSCWTKP